MFDTFVVNMADVFEDYIRLLVATSAEKIGAGTKAKNGNIDQVNLFVDGGGHKVKPDIYLQRGGTNLAVLDAKYKPTLKSADRYEVLAFCEALGAKKAILISPSEGHTAPLLMGKTQGSVEMWLIKIDLSAIDINAAEQQFIQEISQVLN